MEDDRSFVHTLILGACVLICAILIARMVLYHPVPTHAPHRAPVAEEMKQEENGQQMRITQEEVATLLTRVMPETSPITNLRISIWRDGRATLAASLRRDKLQDFMKTYQITSVPRALVFLMPDPCEIEATFSFASDTRSGGLLLTPVDASIGGLRLSAELLEPFGDQAAQALEGALRDRGILFTGLRTEDGAVIFTQ